VGAEVELAVAEADAGVVVVEEIYGEGEDIAVEGDGNRKICDL
jgi:hypothetical protein